MRAREVVVINSGLIESRVCKTIHARFTEIRESR
jgi:hypothetical protein